MSRYVRTISRLVQETVAELRKVVTLHATLDVQGRRQGELSLLQPELPAGRRGPRGAFSVLDSLIRCMEKGCEQDPLDVDGM